MFRIVCLIAVLACVTAFKPMQMTMGVNNFQKQISKALGVGAMAVALSGPMIPQPVQADGANSVSNVYRARNSYGRKIYNLKKDVESGNFAVLGDKSVSNWFDLFISGANRGNNIAVKELRAKETELASTFKAAVAAGDASKAKSAYSDFIKLADLQPEFKANELGQSDSAGAGFSPTWGTDRQYIYQR
jgi:hypothetical protein